MAEASEQRVVLIAIDRSEQAEHAFKYYVESLHRAENRVLVLYCPQMPDSIFGHIHISKKHDEETSEKINKLMEAEKVKWNEVQKKYEELIKANNINGEFVCSPCHRPGEQIVTECTDRAVTMVVCGTRGQGMVRRTLMGSVSDYVVHHAHCPVIVCRM